MGVVDGVGGGGVGLSITRLELGSQRSEASSIHSDHSSCNTCVGKPVGDLG